MFNWEINVSEIVQDSLSKVNGPKVNGPKVNGPKVNGPKDIALEGVRGIAAVVVFVWHFLFAFHEELIFGLENGLIGSPFYAFFHGTAAIDVFFLLSGYVLTRRYFETSDSQLLMTGAFKRWFRLMPIALFCVLLSWACYHFGWHHFVEAGLLVKSSWLFHAAGATSVPVNPSFASALWQGLIGVFFLGEVNFDTSLWTLQIEFYGSLVAFAFAWGLVKLRGGAVRRTVALSLLSAACLAAINLHYVAFVIGPLLAMNAAFYRGLSKRMGLTLLIVGLFLLGYRVPVGLYAIFTPLAYFVPRDMLYTLFSLVGGTLVLVSCVGWTDLNQKMQNGFFRFLGQISFPLYALHVVIICSLGSGVFVAYAPQGLFTARLMATLTVVPTTFGLAYLLSLADQAWVRRLNRTVTQRYFAFRALS